MYLYCMDPCLLTYRLDENINRLHPCTPWTPPLFFTKHACQFIHHVFLHVCMYKKQHVLSELSGLSVMKKEISVSTLQLFETI